MCLVYAGSGDFGVWGIRVLIGGVVEEVCVDLEWMEGLVLMRLMMMVVVVVGMVFTVVGL